MGIGKRRRIDFDTEIADEPTLNEVLNLFNTLESKLQKAVKPANKKSVTKKTVEAISSSFSDLKEKFFALMKQNPIQKSTATPTSATTLTSNAPTSATTPTSNAPSSAAVIDISMNDTIMDTNEPIDNTSKSTGKSHENEKKISGYIKWYDYKKCYGFITYENNSKQIFAHKSSIIKSRIENKKYRTLRQNEPIEFNISTDNNGKLFASNITGPAGINVIGLRSDEIPKMKAEKTSNRLSNTFTSSFKTTNMNQRNASYNFSNPIKNKNQLTYSDAVKNIRIRGNLGKTFVNPKFQQQFFLEPRI
uniref:CSD domain-containing protein n=1 Tax=Panagrolaimus sp. PS1159 TaxID=55785 RepID=A0AC35G4W6_9BILA